MFSSFLCSGSPLPVVSSDPRRAYWALCVEPSEGRRGPCLYRGPADPQPGTPSACSLKSHGRGVPESPAEKTVSPPPSLNSSNCIRTDEIIWTHPAELIHRLVVESGANDVKWSHADGDSDSTDHGSYQSSEPAVWTTPLWGKDGCRDYDSSVLCTALNGTRSEHLPGNVSPSPWPRWRLPVGQLIPPSHEARPRSHPSKDQSNLLVYRWWRRHPTPP